MGLIGSHDYDLSDGVVQLRFADAEDNVQAINAAELAEVLQGLVEFTSQMAATGALGDGIAPVVRVRPPKEGSFIVEAILQYAQSNPVEALTGAMTAGGVVVQSINVGLKKLRGTKPEDFEYLDNGNVKIKWAGGTVDEVPLEAWKKLNTMKRPTQRSLRKILAPLSDDVDTLEVRQGSLTDSTEDVLQGPAEAVADRSDYRLAVAEDDEVVEEVVIFDAEAKLTSIDFRPGEKWRVKTVQGSRLATIEDESFLLALDRGQALHKNDIFEVKIRENRTTKNGRTTTDWSVIGVTFKRRGDDDNDESFEAPQRVE